MTDSLSIDGIDKTRWSCPRNSDQNCTQNSTRGWVSGWVGREVVGSGGSGGPGVVRGLQSGGSGVRGGGGQVVDG